MSPPIGRAFVSRSSVAATVVAVMTAVIISDLAADFAARGRSRMNVHVGGSVAQRADEFLEPGGGKLLRGQSQNVGGGDCSLHRPRLIRASRRFGASAAHERPH